MENSETSKADLSESATRFAREVLDQTFAPYAERLKEKTKRVIRLVEASVTNLESEESTKSAKTEVAEDVLRLAVVFIHAMLEDFLRTLAIGLLPSLDERFLDQVALPGQSRPRAEKFSLGRLANFRGKTVDELIVIAVEKHLETSNFNNTSDIAKFLSALGLQITSAISDTFPDLAKLLGRRHQIVHRGDHLESQNATLGPLRDIAASDLVKWLTSLTEFISAVLEQSALRLAVDSGQSVSSTGRFRFQS